MAKKSRAPRLGKRSDFASLSALQGEDELACLSKYTSRFAAIMAIGNESAAAGIEQPADQVSYGPDALRDA
jgi:hypothetical protein